MTGWECLYSDSKKALDDHLSIKMASKSVLEFGAVDPGGLPAELRSGLGMAVAERAGALRHVVLLTMDTARTFYTLVSAYPVATDGTQVSLRISEVRPWGNGFEGNILGRTDDGQDVGFFDPLFFKNVQRYVIGQSIAVRLAAFGYSARPERRDFIVIPGAQAAEIHARNGIESSEPIRVRLKGFIGRRPVEGFGPDHWAYAAPLMNLERLNTDGGQVLRLTIGLLPSRIGPSIEAPLYIGAHLVEAEGNVLESGRQIEGAYWLQGYPADMQHLFDASPYTTGDSAGVDRPVELT